MLATEPALSPPAHQCFLPPPFHSRDRRPSGTEFIEVLNRTIKRDMASA
jgi:hypothetical protein